MMTLTIYGSAPFGGHAMSPAPRAILPASAAYPGSIATNLNLSVAVNRAQTRLASPVDNSAGAITVLDASSIVAGMLLSIDSEIMQVTGTPTGNSVPVARAFDSTTAGPHLASALVSGFVCAFNHNALAAEIKAIETTLGPNLSNVSDSALVVSTKFNFAPQTPGFNLTPGAQSIPLSPMPAGLTVGGYLRIFGGTGGPDEACPITGVGPSNVIVTVANPHSGAWQIGSSTAGIQEALGTLGAGQGTVFVPRGTHNIYSPIRIMVSSQGVIGAPAYLKKMTASGNLFDVRATTGTIFFNFVENFLLTSDSGLTPINGAMIYTDTNTRVGRIKNITVQYCWIGVQHFGQNWTGSDVTVLDTQAPGNSYAFNLRGGLWTNIQAITSIRGGTGVMIDGPCDGLQITNIFIEGMFLEALIFHGYDATVAGRVVDVSIANIMIDTFTRHGIVFEGAQTSLVTITNIHLENQVADAENGAGIYFNSTQASRINIVGGRFLYLRREGILASSTLMTNIMVMGCNFYNCSYGVPGSVSAIFRQNPQHFHLVGNNFGHWEGDVNTHKYDMELSGQMDDSLVQGNIFAGFLTAGVLYPTTINNSVIGPNVGEPEGALIVYMPASFVLLAGTYSDLPGVTLTIARPGLYRIEACFDFSETGAGDINQVMLGQLMVNGVAQTNTAVFTPQNQNDRATVFQQWLVRVGVGQIVKLRAQKTAGSGASVAATQTSLSAIFVES